MHLKTSISFSFILYLLLIYSIQGQNSTDDNSTSTLVTAATTTSSQTSTSTVLSCLGDYIDPPNCTKCASNYESKDGKCVEKKIVSKPSGGIVRRIFLILLGCLLTVVLIVAMFIGYGRLNQQHRRRSSINQENPPDSSNGNNRFQNILRSIGLNNLNKRGRFNFFSISNNNNSSGPYRQAETSRAHLNENPDEALLFDDPYADGGLQNSAANPYKSLTLAVT